MDTQTVQKGSLYIVATPIGNLKDITLRALEVLSRVDILLAEDTRSTHVLLAHYGIKPAKILSYHSHNEEERASYIMNCLSSNSVALVSDAGTPLICDPGILLVKAVISSNYQLISIPGASAFTTLLAITGFSLKDFYFKGFLSVKKNKKLEQIKELFKIKTVIIIYESSHRIKSTLTSIGDVFSSQTQVVIGREITKKFETIYRERLSKMIENVENEINFVLKGEFCIILDNRL